MSGSHPADSVATPGAVIALITDYGSDPYDEELSQSEHALQTAALARSAGATDELVAAALMHDVGHLLDIAAGRIDGAVPDADLGHEATGARWLAGGFGPAVTGPIALHVRAKRYLCATDPSYHDSLSAGSQASLARQGGPMTPAEVSAFEANPNAQAAIQLRRWDDGGKVEGLPVPALAEYRDLLENVAISPVAD